MAQAGFYHNPSSNGEDRAMCFTCNVCLVSWEPTDEPWSEHERHSPFCPFVRGEHTHNVPLSLSYATAPSFVVQNAHGMGLPVVGKSSHTSGFVMGYSKGFVILWDISKQAKVKFELSFLYSGCRGLNQFFFLKNHGLNHTIKNHVNVPESIKIV